MAGWDFRKAREVATWPIREALLAFTEKTKGKALVGYRWESLQYAVLAPYVKKDSGRKPPEVPDILKQG